MYELKEVKTLKDLEILRKIRNSCRLFMTNNQNEITKEQQIEWFINKDSKTIPYVFLVDSLPVGYGLIAYKDLGRPWLSGGLLENYRGKGYGKILFQSLVGNCKSKKDPNVYLDVFKDNIPAIETYQKIGFDITESKKDRYVMRLNLE
jgi:GNAT superfamily N-acetyltransferase